MVSRCFEPIQPQGDCIRAGKNNLFFPPTALMLFWQPFVFPNPIGFDQFINIMEILICTVVVQPSDPQLFDYTTVAQEYEGKEYFN